MRIFDRLRQAFSRVFIPPQDTHELLKNPVTIPEEDPAPVQHSPSTPTLSTPLKPWVREIKENKQYK